MGILSKPRTTEQLDAELIHARDELASWLTECGAVEHEIAALLAAGEDDYSATQKLSRLEARIKGQRHRLAELESDRKAADLVERIQAFKTAERQRAADYQALKETARQMKAIRAEYEPKMRALDDELKRRSGHARNNTDAARAMIKALADDGLDPVTIAELQGIMQDVSNSAPMQAAIWF